MATLNIYDDLEKLSKNLTLSSRVHSDCLSQVIRKMDSINVISQTISKQFYIEQKLFRSATTILEQVNRAMAISPSIQSLTAANSSLAQIANRLLIPESSFAKIFESQKHIQNMLKGMEIDGSISAAFARIDTSRILSASLAAQVKLANFDKISLGTIAGFDSMFSKSLTANLANMTRSYKSLFDVTSRDALGKYLPLITTYSPVEYYREINVLETITIDESSEGEVDKSIETSIAEFLPSVDSLLIEFNPKLGHLLEGARQSLRVNNPDRARHVTASVRELFTQVLHELAPDASVRQWTTNSELFHDNRPTRRARLLYICRNINCDPLTRFVEDDVRAALSFVESLNAGTHVLESKLTQIQLSSIVSRMESLLVFLLQLRKNS